MIFKTEMHLVDKQPCLVLIGRDDDGNPVIKPKKDFKYWFFVDEDCPLESFSDVYKTEKGYTSIMETPVKKVFINNYFNLRKFKHKIQDMGYKTWESDIPMTNRYFMEMEDEPEKPKFKVCHFDIETAPETTFDEGEDVETQRFPDIEKADQVICSISVEMGGKITSWLCGPRKIDGVRYFEDEECMLEDFLEFINEESPDILSAYNLDYFDLPYLINRCTRLGINYNLMSKLNEVQSREVRGNTFYNAKGTILFDLLKAYKLWRKYGNMTVLESYSLDHVSRTVLDDKKLDHGKTISYLWKYDAETLIEYNRHDVRLMRMLDDKCKIIDFFDNVRRISRIQFEDVYKTTSIVDGYLISRLKEKIILPDSNPGAKGDRFAGAFVFEPEPGVYDNILCQDVSSMYPSIIRNYNISFETVGGTDIVIPYKNMGFKKEPGVIPMFLQELADFRAEAKQKLKQAKKDNDKTLMERYHQLQYGFKIISNCFSEDTEIMTPCGKKNIKNMKKGDLVYSINPKTKELEIKPVVETQVFDYSGEMIHFKSNSMDLMVTPNHNMIVETAYGDKKFVQAKDYKTHEHIPLHTPLKTRKINKTFDLFEHASPNDYKFFIYKDEDLRILKSRPEFENITLKKINMDKCEGNKKIPRFNTCSKKLAEQVQIILLELGYNFSVTKTKTCYRIYFYKKNTKPHKNHITKINNNSNKVYCVTVKDNHTVYAGRNNKFCWTGQSVYGYIGYPGSRLYRPEVAEAVTGMGQILIKLMAEKAEDIFGTKVIYSDTDSVVYDSIVNINTEEFNCNIEIGKLFELEMAVNDENTSCDNKYIVKPHKTMHSPTVNKKTGIIENKKIKYIMGHKVKKEMFKITVDGNELIVTEDHSIMVKRNGEIIEVTPKQILPSDKLLIKMEK